MSPGNGSQLVAASASSIAVSGFEGSMGANGDAVYGYIDQYGNFFVRRGASGVWQLAAQHAKSMAVATTTSGRPVLAYLSTAGDFYAEQGSLNGPFTLEARDVVSIALAAGGDSAPPLLGYVTERNGRLPRESRCRGRRMECRGHLRRPLDRPRRGSHTPRAGSWDIVSDGGHFFASAVTPPRNQWTQEATGVTAIGLAVVGPSGEPLLGYLAGSTFYVAEGLAPAIWVEEASGVAQIARWVRLGAGRLAGSRLCHDLRQPRGTARPSHESLLVAGSRCLVVRTVECHRLVSNRPEARE